MHHPVRFLALATIVIVGGACTSNAAEEGTGVLKVSSTADTCDVSAAAAPSGNLVFEVVNDGSEITEFYLLAEDGLKILGEVENIGPGISRNLVVEASPGNYFTVCKPGMVGDGIRAPFTVTGTSAESGSGSDGGAASTDISDLVLQATAQYQVYVHDEIEQLVEKTRLFAELYTSGQDDQARDLYPAARTHWERIEPVAESFGDLDPRLDLREADLEQGQEWTGWHAIEKDLWPPADGYNGFTDAQRIALADQLVADTVDLAERTKDITFTAPQLGNGAKELLDEVATGKVTGEEEIWSHTDLWDFQANIDGARTAFEALKPALEQKDKTLAVTLTERFARVQDLLDQHREGDGFVLYTTLTADQIKQLADAVNALGEPLAELTAAVVL